MTTQLEQAARLALEVLSSSMYPQPQQMNAITALRAALEQPAQDESVYFCDYGYEGWEKVDAATAAQNITYGMTVESYYTRPQPVPTSDTSQNHVDETAKQRHEWVGLNDSEIGHITKSFDARLSVRLGVSRAIEAKLKEKNT